MTPPPIKILLVEDNRGDAVLLEEMLRRNAPGQFEVRWTTCLAETLEHLGRETFDAALLDLSLPDSQGLETITRVCRAAPAMPILVMTGLTDERIAGEAVHSAAQDYLVKGQTDVRSMARAIRYAVERKQDQEALKAAKEAAEQANDAKDRFLAVLSHELRTPLTPVMMGLSMLQERADLAPPFRETLETVRRNVELEARLIDDLLDVSRIAQGKVVLSPTTVKLAAIIQRAVEVCQPDIEARGLRFSVEMGAAAACRVEADEPRMQQVFWNLLKNAVKFTPHGGRVSVRCRPAGGHVVVEVSDSGIGIEAEAMSRIFNAFEQAERSITRQFGGLGLGLAISRAMVEMHGGRIEAQSDGPGKGATFRVYLPLAAPAAPGGPSPARPDDHEYVVPDPLHGCPADPLRGCPAAVRPLRILLVEDHSVTAKMMRMVLASDGHAVDCAPTLPRRSTWPAGSPSTSWSAIWGCPTAAATTWCASSASAGTRFPA